MPKTRAEIDTLKLSWREDPTWDIEETEGFEDHRAELSEYRRDIESERDAAAAKRRAVEIAKIQAPARAVYVAMGRFPDEELLTLAAEMLLPLQRQLERQAEDIEAMQRHEDELDALRRKIGAR